MIDVGQIPRYETLPPAEKLLTLVFALVGKDKADQLVLDHSLIEPAVRMSYRVDGKLWELVPPPVHVWPAIVRCLKRNSRLIPRRLSNLFRRGAFPDFPAGGTLPVRYGDETCKFDILFFRGRTAQHIWVEKLDAFDVSQISAEFMRRRMHVGRNGLTQF
jgi:hypothetical protein